MLFPTGEFFVFFCFVLVVSWMTERVPGVRKFFLLLASYFFYGFWDWRLLPLFFVSSLTAWGFGALLGMQVGSTDMALARRRLFVFVCSLFAFLLFWFKYQLFLLTQINSLLLGWNLPFLLPVNDSILPLGISFYTFQILSYLSDIYHGKEQARQNPVDVLLYLAFFPQLIAGPILRPAEFFPQLDKKTPVTEERITRAYLLITSGLWKKVIVAHYLGSLVVDPVFHNPAALSGAEVWWALLAYGAQIFTDFSAYTDLALGTALLLGFDLPKNFDRPYHSASLTEFWRRWHITLGRWLRDYLYIPLGGSRGGTWKTSRNLFLTMLLGGLWHGANITFVIWGAYQGILLVLERWLGKLFCFPGFWGPLLRPPRVIFTTLAVSLGWLLFRSPDVETAGAMFQRLGTPGGFTAHPLALILVGVVYLGQWIPEGLWSRMSCWSRKLSRNSALLVLILSLWGISILRPPGMAPFVYYQF